MGYKKVPNRCAVLGDGIFSNDCHMERLRVSVCEMPNCFILTLKESAEGHSRQFQFLFLYAAKKKRKERKLPYDLEITAYK